eukprot:GHUV01044619.1.p2 GENE.GHUV01044619.1~~GHUV01044619.1.p2  ORF type:complete len:125 (+),score=26.38 GHUV01044619.1:527-901(+)
MLADRAGQQQIHFAQYPLPADTGPTTTNSGSITGSTGTYSIAAQGQQLLRPLQSWQQLGGIPLNIDPQRPVLCMRRLPGVVRRDECARFSLQECCSNSGLLGLVTDRLIPEIAYKLGRAPKYGA